jgi:pyridinium-3,5-bisthiocarboxylic acid mononucleotide nickel chelatase
MRIGYLDCFSGISGDMLLGALAAAGVDHGQLSALPGLLGLHHVTVTFEAVKRGGVAATKAHVKIEKPADGHHHHRSLSTILKMIAASSISDAVKDSSSRVFRKLGEAEASIHGVPVEKVHFHEVGAEDSIVDIVGGCLGLHALGIEKLVCSSLDVGAGTVETAHGRLPVPAPATARLLAGAPVYSSGIEVELVTPTGAAMVATLATFGAMPRMTIFGDGYGAGSRDLAGRPNVLRLLVGTQETDAATADAVTVLEANLDDMSPQIAGYVLGKAIAMGALDCYFTPVQMKKGRPGLLITVLAAPTDAGRLSGLLFSETSTLGVRSYQAERRTLQRRHETVETTWGPVRVKVASRDGKELHFAPEYEDCLALAEQHRVPLKHVLEQASASYLKAQA